MVDRERGGIAENGEDGFALIDYQIKNFIRRREAQIIVETTPAIVVVRSELMHYGLDNIHVVICRRKDPQQKVAAELVLAEQTLKLYYQGGKLQKENESTVIRPEYRPLEGRILFTPRVRINGAPY